MNYLDIVLTLVFSVVMLMFMAYPAMKLSEIIEKRFDISESMHNILVIFLVVLLSLSVGIFLKYF